MSYFFEKETVLFLRATEDKETLDLKSVFVFVNTFDNRDSNIESRRTRKIRFTHKNTLFCNARSSSMSSRQYNLVGGTQSAFIAL